MKRVHWYYKFLIVFLIVFSMFFFFNKSISNFVNTSSLKDYAVSIFKPVSSIKSNLIFDRNLVKENKKLKKELLKDNTILKENDSLKDEIDDLKKLMKLKETYTGYKRVYAKTIIRNKMYWYNTITIDKGRGDGIEKGNAVVGINGLIGIVYNTTKNSSSIKLITNNDTGYRLSGMIKKEKETVVGLIEGYDYPYIKVSLVESSNKVQIGDEFYSYGLEHFSKNIYIGEVKKIEKDNYDLGDIIYIEPKQDMNDINYVVVLGNK